MPDAEAIIRHCDLTVADPADESAYVPALERLGYDLVVREPSWRRHRCLRLESPRVNLHFTGVEGPKRAARKEGFRRRRRG